MSHLVVFTNRYPFRPGEEYLHTEIPYLAQEFDDVTLVPLMPGSSAEHGRTLPRNTKVVQADPRQGHIERLRHTLRGPQTRGYAAGASRGLISRLYERYFWARSESLAELVGPPLARRLEEVGPPDVIYAYWFYVTTSVPALLRRSMPEMAGRPLVARGHGYDVNEAASPVKYLPGRARLLEEVDRLHPTAETITRRLRGQWPDQAHKITTRRLGVRLAGPVARPRAETLRILSCSSLSPIKRVPLMADAVAALVDQGHDVRWTHLGTGSPQQVGELNRRISKLGIQNVVKLPGHVSNDEVYRILTSGRHHVSLNTSSSKSVSFSMSEALGAGLPVVGADVVGTHEVLHDGRNGVLLPPNPSASQVAAALLAVWRQPEDTYRAWQRHAVQVCAELFDPDRLYRAFAADLAHIGRVS
ncbi:glycosyltransferase [Micrococcus sp. R8502A1]|uniref:glycosyltransferase n=1 Tax=Micrococcus sp. R8502A1 TaxID=2583239 RepID=UPI00114D5DAE|nr:glycosyltransferase [Micrococcus sp. R8502A1]TQF65515.1 glycosyltransferase [Micrococcus sp. R8502A1]